MNKSTCIHYNPRYGWDLNSDANLEMRLFAKAQRRQVTILSYGCDLDHHTIKKLLGTTSLGKNLTKPKKH